MNQTFVDVVCKRVSQVIAALPRVLLDETLFHTLKEEFEMTLPRNVSTVTNPDLLNRRSSTPTYGLDYQQGKLMFKFSNDQIVIRHQTEAGQYEDYKGFKDCFGLLNSLTTENLNDSSGANPN